MLATEKSKYPNPAELAVATGQRGTLGAQASADKSAAISNQSAAAEPNIERNAAMMCPIKKTTALKAIFDGEGLTENFVRKFVVGPSANVFAVGKLGTELAKDPAAQQAVRGSVVAWLKDRAVGTGLVDETARSDALRYNQAVATIGERKLKALGFTPEEVAQLKAVGRVGSYTSHQPVGSAVNNSNSGALLLGRSFDALDAIASKFPLLNLGPQISAVTGGVQQSQPRTSRRPSRAAP